MLFAVMSIGVSKDACLFVCFGIRSPNSRLRPLGESWKKFLLASVRPWGTVNQLAAKAHYQTVIIQTSDTAHVTMIQPVSTQCLKYFRSMNIFRLFVCLVCGLESTPLLIPPSVYPPRKIHNCGPVEPSLRASRVSGAALHACES